MQWIKRVLSPTEKRTNTVTALLFFAQIFLVVLVFSDSLAQNWVFVALYLVSALYAAFYRMPLLAATGFSVALVRALIAVGVGGVWLQVASVVFAGLFFACVIEGIRVKQKHGL